jgi:Bacterial trigger factor protein (TF) C-terminus
LDASRRQVPELTDAFAARVKPGLTAETLLAQLTKAIDDENSREFAPARNKALGDALTLVMDVDVPDTLVTNQAREKFAVMMAEMRDGGVSDEEIKRQISPENFQKYKDIVKDDIVRDFKISMATDEIARLEGIDVPDYQVEEQMEAIRKDAEKDEAFDENLIRSKVKNTLVRQAVMDWLAERSKLQVEYVNDNEPEFDEALLTKLAEESLERERAATLAKESTSGTSSTGGTPTSPSLDVDAEVFNGATPAASGNDGSSAGSVIDAELVPKSETMTLEEKAFAALVNAGAVELNLDPSDPNYDPSQDNEIAPGTVLKQ